MKPTIEQMTAWFDEFNNSVFCGELPRVKITFNNTRRQLGQFHWGAGRGLGIKISLFWDRTGDQYRNCLLHEMCHLYCYNRGWLHEGHGIRWKRIADYASRQTGLQIQRCEDIAGWVPSS
jgi:predicted SprT family Zn-dependent metalloprotease